MKKQFCILLLLCLICLLAASCSKNAASQDSAYGNLQTDNSNGNGNNADNDSAATQSSVTENAVGDVDLTVLSSTMIYAEVYNIMTDPDVYVGRTIKGSGVYNSFYYEEIDRRFHYFIISDATGCCPQGIDFVWNGEHIYPDDYPEIGENIEVTGVFAKGEIEGQPYYHLVVDDISVLK